MKNLLNYELNRMRSSWEYQHKKTILMSRPYITNIEVTNSCNLRCGFCAVGLQKLNRKQGLMSYEVFHKLMRENRENMYSICLFYHGEPLLHLDLPYFIKELHRSNVGVGISTNGLLLTKEVATTLLESGLNSLNISFQGTNRETYSQDQMGGDFDKVEKNIFALLDVRDMLRSSVKIYVSLIRTPGLSDYDVIKFSKTWVKRGVTVTVSQLEPWFGLVKPNIREISNSICSIPYRSVAILWNGDVIPSGCDYEGEPMGNILDSSLNEIWNGEKFVNLRHNLTVKRDNLSYPCNICRKAYRSPDGFQGFLGERVRYVKDRFERRRLRRRNEVIYLEMNRCVND